MISKIEIACQSSEIVLVVTIKKDILFILRNKRKPDFNKRVAVLKNILEENKFIKRVILKVNCVYLSDDNINTLIDTITSTGIYPSHISLKYTGLSKPLRKIYQYDMLMSEMNGHFHKPVMGIYEQIENRI